MRSSALAISGDEVPESVPEVEAEESSVPSLPGTGFDSSDFAVSVSGGNEAFCLPDPEVN